MNATMTQPVVHKTRRLGEGKSLREIYEETNAQLLTNMMKGLHLDGGGKQDHYDKRARHCNSILAEGGESALAHQLWVDDNTRMVALRKSILKRVVLLQCREKHGDALTFEKYETAYLVAISVTEDHPKKLRPSQIAK